MTRIVASINKETLEHICTQIGVTAAFLAERTEQTEERICSWLDIKNDDFPTINQAKSVAKALKVPLAGLYMSKENIPIQKLPKLRNLRTLSGAETMDDSAINLAVAELIRYHDFMISSESDMEIESAKLSLPAISKNASVIGYSKIIREFFNIELNEQFKLTSPRKFYLYVRQKIENKGVFVHCFTGVDVEIARGISIYNDTAPIIGINGNDRHPAKTFSIVHELVHILKRQSTFCNEMFSSFSNKNEEVFCNAVAGETLIPKASLDVYLTAKDISAISLSEINTIAKRYSVSKEVAARRLFDTNWVTKDKYDTIANEIHQNFLEEREAEKIARKEGRGRKIPKNVSREAIDKTSSNLCKILSVGYNEGYFSKQDVSGYLGIKEKHIKKFLAEVGKW